MSDSPEGGCTPTTASVAVVALLAALLGVGGYFGYRAVASTGGETAYQRNVRSMTTQILADVTGTEVVLAGPVIDWNRGPRPMTLRIESGPAGPLSVAEREAFGAEIHAQQCVFYDYKPRASKQYPHYELRIELASGEVLARELVEPGDCFCGRPRSDQREVCEGIDET